MTYAGKAAIYILVGPHEKSADDHISECQHYCRSRSLQYDLYREAVTEIRERRPELAHLLSRLRAGEYTVVVVWKLRDFGTSALHFYDTLGELRNKNIEIVIKSLNGLSTSTMEGKRLVDTVAEIGEFEKTFIKERIRASLDTKKEKGIPLGRKLGSKDKKPRSKAGYVARQERARLQATKPSQDEEASG